MVREPASSSVVMRRMVEAFATGDVSSVEEYVHPDYLNHQGLPGHPPITGIEGFVHVVEVARRGYVEQSIAIEDLIEGPDRVAARLVWSGLRSSGEPAHRETIDIVRVEAGLAIEHWGARS